MAIVRRKVRGEDAHRREAQRTHGEPVEDDGEPPRRACRLDAVVGFGFGQAQDFHAVREERREPRAQVEPAGVELRQVSDETRGGLALATGKGRDLGQKLGVREMGRNVDLHGVLHTISTCLRWSVAEWCIRRGKSLW